MAQRRPAAKKIRLLLVDDHEVVRLGLPLTVNMVVHRGNIERITDMVELALKLGASRIEVAHVQ